MTNEFISGSEWLKSPLGMFQAAKHLWRGSNSDRPDGCNKCSGQTFPSSSNQSKSTIFEIYSPWESENIQKDVDSLPHDTLVIFDAILKGRIAELQELLNNPKSASLANERDSKERTPLHFASALGNFKAVELLISSGADTNALDGSGCITPLMCAAVVGDERVMNLLLEKDADINYGLNNLNNFLENNLLIQNHPKEIGYTALIWAVKAGNDISVKFLLAKGALIYNGTDMNICYQTTPLHEAADLGYDRILKILLNHNYCSNFFKIKAGLNKNTVLHVAVEKGHEKCIETLLSNGAPTDCLNALKQTPLHIAAEKANFDAMVLLLMYKANPDAQDDSLRTPLHYCVTQYKDQRNMECIELLITSNCQVDLQDDLGYTAFHRALDQEDTSIASYLLRCGADLTRRINTGRSGLELLVENMPHAIPYLKESLDSAVTSEKNTVDPKCEVILNFRAIVTNCGRNGTETSKSVKETEFLSSLYSPAYKSILTHPLIESFLILKWQKVRKYFWISLILNLIMVITYSFFLVIVYNVKCQLSSVNCPNEKDKGKDVGLGLPILWVVLIIMMFVFVTKEVVQIIQSPRTYVKLYENYVDLAFVIIFIVTTVPVGGAISNDTSLCSRLNEWSYRFAAVGILVAWLLILFRVGKMPTIGLYVQMLLKVVANFAIFMTAYTSILIAFGLAFNILLDKRPEFQNFGISFLSVLVMMTGEVDIGLVTPSNNSNPISCNSTSFSKDDETRTLPFVANFMFAIFVLLVTIVLMNLLVGLAVSDIQGLHKGAKAARLSRLVVAISQLESILYSRGKLTGLLPNSWLKALQTNALLIPSDEMFIFKFKPHNPRDKKLPKTLQIEALNIVETREREQTRINKSKKCCTTGLKNVSIEPLLEKIKDAERKLDCLGSKIDMVVAIMESKIEIVLSKLESK